MDMTRHNAPTAIAAACILAALTWAGPAPAQAPDLTAAKRDYRRPPPLAVANPALAALGRELFFDPLISASGKTACASCHAPELGWVVKDARPTNDSGKPSGRKSQPLIGIGHAGSAPVGWDGRNASLEAQAKNSIATGSMSMSATPTPVKVETIVERVASSPNYAPKFAAALPGKPIDIEAVTQAIAAFERTIEPGLSPFDRWIGGDEAAIPPAAKRGFALFNGKAGCSACHSGWRFTDDQFHDIGTSTTDLGRGRDVKDVHLNYAFKTPTLRSVALRAPYMNNASQATLDDVVRFYEKGGIARESRSPMLMPLGLTDQDRSDLVAFMESLTADDAKQGK
jgi:cytochrome c peroxidase